MAADDTQPGAADAATADADDDVILGLRPNNLHDPLVIAMVLLPLMMSATTPTLREVTASTDQLAVYDIWSVSVAIDGVIDHPFDREMIALWALVTVPGDEEQVRIPGFYHEPVSVDEQAGTLVADVAAGSWLVRYTPRQQRIGWPSYRRVRQYA